jgi:hypothetical protein
LLHIGVVQRKHRRRVVGIWSPLVPATICLSAPCPPSSGLPDSGATGSCRSRARRVATRPRPRSRLTVATPGRQPSAGTRCRSVGRVSGEPRRPTKRAQDRFSTSYKSEFQGCRRQSVAGEDDSLVVAGGAPRCECFAASGRSLRRGRASCCSGFAAGREQREGILNRVSSWAGPCFFLSRLRASRSRGAARRLAANSGRIARSLPNAYGARKLRESGVRREWLGSHRAPPQGQQGRAAKIERQIRQLFRQRGDFTRIHQRGDSAGRTLTH